MVGARAMRRSTGLILALAATSVVVTGALAWFAWALIERERELEAQRARAHAEAAADAVAAAVRSRLSDAGDRLSAWLSDSDESPPAIDGAAVLGVRGRKVNVTPRGALPFIPFWPPATPPSPLFTEAEQLEFAADQSLQAAERYRALTTHPDSLVRAAAWHRLGRALMRARDHRGAFQAYSALAAIGELTVEAFPAELRALDGLHRIHRLRGDEANAAKTAELIVSRIDDGRWQLSRGQAAHYRDEHGEKPYLASWRLAHALADVWAAHDDGPSSRGYRLISYNGDQTVVVWRSGRSGVAALAAPARVLFAGSAPEGVSWTLTTASSSSGADAAPAGALARDIAGVDEDWRLYVLPAAPLSAGRARERVIGSTVAAAIGFIWAAAFFIGRALRREARVARLQSDFVAAVSHEFRTPVTAVRQISEMLDMGRLDDAGRVRQYYSVLVAQSMRLQRLVETLLTFGRMEAGAKQYQLAPTAIEVVVRGAVADVVTLAEHSRTTVDLVGVVEPVIVDADEDALRMAVRNLLENAIKYSPGRPVVWIRWRADRERAAIEVEDHGLGIDAAERRTIFRKFVRGRAAVEARVKGTGVGLAVVQHIVTAHRGALTVVSQPGRGSTFSIVLPRRDSGSTTVAGGST